MIRFLSAIRRTQIHQRERVYDLGIVADKYMTQSKRPKESFDKLLKTLSVETDVEYNSEINQQLRFAT